MMAATPSPKVIEGRDDFPKGFATNALASYAESPPPCGWLKMTAVFLGLMRSPCLASSLSREARAACMCVASCDQNYVSSMNAPPDWGGGGPLAGGRSCWVSLRACSTQSPTILLKSTGLSGNPVLPCLFGVWW